MLAAAPGHLQLGAGHAYSQEKLHCVPKITVLRVTGVEVIRETQTACNYGFLLLSTKTCRVCFMLRESPGCIVGGSKGKLIQLCCSALPHPLGCILPTHLGKKSLKVK